MKRETRNKTKQTRFNEDVVVQCQEEQFEAKRKRSRSSKTQPVHQSPLKKANIPQYSQKSNKQQQKDKPQQVKRRQSKSNAKEEQKEKKQTRKLQQQEEKKQVSKERSTSNNNRQGNIIELQNLLQQNEANENSRKPSRGRGRPRKISTQKQQQQSQIDEQTKNTRKPRQPAKPRKAKTVDAGVQCDYFKEKYGFTHESVERLIQDAIAQRAKSQQGQSEENDESVVRISDQAVLKSTRSRTQSRSRTQTDSQAISKKPQSKRKTPTRQSQAAVDSQRARSRSRGGNTQNKGRVQQNQRKPTNSDSRKRAQKSKSKPKKIKEEDRPYRYRNRSKKEKKPAPKRSRSKASERELSGTKHFLKRQTNNQQADQGQNNQNEQQQQEQLLDKMQVEQVQSSSHQQQQRPRQNIEVQKSMMMGTGEFASNSENIIIDKQISNNMISSIPQQLPQILQMQNRIVGNPQQHALQQMQQQENPHYRQNISRRRVQNTTQEPKQRNRNRSPNLRNENRSPVAQVKFDIKYDLKCLYTLKNQRRSREPTIFNLYDEKYLPWKDEFGGLKHVGRDDDIETDEALVHDTKKNLLIELQDKIKQYVREKNEFGTAERLVRNLRPQAFAPVIKTRASSGEGMANNNGNDEEYDEELTGGVDNQQEVQEIEGSEEESGSEDNYKIMSDTHQHDNSI